MDLVGRLRLFLRDYSYWVHFSLTVHMRTQTSTFWSAVFCSMKVQNLILRILKKFHEYISNKCKTVFWDIRACSLLKINRQFWGTCLIYLQGGRISQARNQHEVSSMLRPWRWRRHDSPNLWMTFNELLGIIS